MGLLMPVLHPIVSPRGFTILPVHYSHDPEKTAAWADAKRATYPTEDRWMQEMEIDFRSHAGNPAYPAFKRAVHLVPGLSYLPQLPLCLMVDFNVSPMIWLVGQIVKGKPRIIAQVKRAPTSIEEMVREFRNMYPAHPADLVIYGDATGNARTAQTARSDYDLLRLAFRGYSGDLVMKVPASNPFIKDRLNAVNRMLKGADGLPGIEIDDEACPDLVRDLEEVVLVEKKTSSGQAGIDILKSHDPEDPYHERTHASDGLGYFIHREWPVALEQSRSKRSASRPPLKFGKMLGDG